ncbi:MAG: hypothetical protein J1F60_04055 [Oscillospiraceae bacterium]|nr:hypothetical protein [Oscillospiraceae bacterium]
MKKRLSLILAAILLFTCTACSNTASDPYSSALSSLSSDADTSGIGNAHTDGKIDFESVPAPEKSIPPSGNNSITKYTSEEVSGIINGTQKLTAANSLYVDAPKSIDHVSSFYSGTTAMLPPKDGIENFLSMFKYLFPDHEFDESCFYYVGGSSTIEYDKDTWQAGEPEPVITKFFNTVGEKYDELVNGEEELLYFYYSEELMPREHSVEATLRSPFGSDICMVNKGVCEKIAAESNGEETYFAHEHVFASSYFEYVDSFYPDSGEVFKLLDREISIKDAVAFFEDYMNTLPSVITTSYLIHVNKVNVYKVRDDLCCYEYIYSRMYDGVPFDYVVNGSRNVRDNADMAFGGMIKSDDVDYFYGAFRTATVLDETVHSEIIPLYEAVMITADSLTDYVDFEVISVQFLYCCDKMIGYALGEAKNFVFPAWKLILHNSNDDKDYICYVNALDGKFEYYRE